MYMLIAVVGIVVACAAWGILRAIRIARLTEHWAERMTQGWPQQVDAPWPSTEKAQHAEPSPVSHLR